LQPVQTHIHALRLQTCAQHILQCFLHHHNHATVVLVKLTMQVTRVPDAPATLDQLDCLCHPVTLSYRLPLQTSPVRTTAQVGQHPICCIIAVHLGVQALQFRAGHTTKLDDAPPVMHVHSMKCPVQLVKELQLCAAASWAFRAVYVSFTCGYTSCLLYILCCEHSVVLLPTRHHVHLCIHMMQRAVAVVQIVTTCLISGEIGSCSTFKTECA